MLNEILKRKDKFSFIFWTDDVNLNSKPLILTKICKSIMLSSYLIIISVIIMWDSWNKWACGLKP